MTLTLSPVIVGSVLTIIIIGVAIAIRIFVVTFVHNLRRNRQHGNKATAAGVVTQAGDVFKVSVNVRKIRSSTCFHFSVPTLRLSEFLMQLIMFDDILQSNNLEKPRWQHTDIKTKSSEDLVEDERDPDVIPSQYGKHQIP